MAMWSTRMPMTTLTRTSIPILMSTRRERSQNTTTSTRSRSYTGTSRPNTWAPRMNMRIRPDMAVSLVIVVGRRAESDTCLRQAERVTQVT